MKLLLLIACIIGMAFSAPSHMYMEFDIHHAPPQVMQPKPFLLQSQWDPWKLCSQLTARGSLLEDLSMGSSSRKSPGQMAKMKRSTTPLGSTCQIQL
ncbi:hypothetical protein AMECASPLE_012621 [Ameca splendens]|uniref:Uncharacterized protein n=1 Tax=Ameca splendens TaxID=208324 RepID=A0ABV0YZ67_9TELE